MAMGKLVEKPQINIVTSVLHRPMRIMGFRPKRSEAAPQGMPVKPWHMEKMAEVRPAQRAMSSSGTPNHSIISGR
jgi:hypothetical protein